MPVDWTQYINWEGVALLPYIGVVAIIIFVIGSIFNWGYPLTEGGNVCEKHHKHCCEQEPLKVTVKFEEPVEVNVNVKIEPPEPEVRGLLTIGPVSKKQS